MAQTITKKSAQTLIIGTGIAGSVAALAAAQAGGDVLVVGQKPGGTAQWSGVADVFGSVLRDPTTGETITENGPRLTSLLQRRRRHPYAVLGMRDAAQVEAYWSRAAQLLEGLVNANARGWCATGLGVPRWADGASPTVAPGIVPNEAPAGDLVFVGLEGFSGLDATQAAATYKTLAQTQCANTTHNAHGVRLTLGATAGVWNEEPSAIARQIETISRPEFIEQLKTLAAQTHTTHPTRWLFPAVLGRDSKTSRAFLDALSNALSASGGGDQVAELPGMDRSLHGWRLHTGLQEKLAQTANVNCLEKQVETIRNLAGNIEVVLRGGDVLRASRVILAMGRFVSGGLPRSGPWQEPLTSAPLYLDGHPIHDAGGLASRLLSTHFLDDHPLMRIGLGISPDGRVLDENRQIISPHIYAVGSMLEGASHSDGCAMGLAVCTALRVADTFRTP